MEDRVGVGKGGKEGRGKCRRGGMGEKRNIVVDFPGGGEGKEMSGRLGLW